MIRDKNNYLKAFKQKKQLALYLPQPTIPLWAYQFSSYKDILDRIRGQNIELSSLIQLYKANPSVYNYKKTSSLVNEIHKDIIRVTVWAQNIGTIQTGTADAQVIDNMSKSMQREATIESQKFQVNKNLFDSIDRSLDQPGQSKNVSILMQNKQLHHKTNVRKNINIHNALQRERVFQNVTGNIHQVHGAIGRMANLANVQGQVIQIIDNHLESADDNMKKGNQQLRQRLRYEQGDDGDGVWGIGSRVNKAIMFFYVLNIVLIIVWFVKHL